MNQGTLLDPQMNPEMDPAAQILWYHNQVKFSQVIGSKFKLLWVVGIGWLLDWVVGWVGGEMGIKKLTSAKVEVEVEAELGKNNTEFLKYYF